MPIDRATLQTMVRTLIHRGPDDEGFFMEGPVAVGMRRLSIIDVEGGRQPIANEPGRIQTICNGEIYNFRSLRETLTSRGHVFRTRTDTEVIVHAYEEYGLEFVTHLWPRLYERASGAIQVMVGTLRDPLYLLRLWGWVSSSSAWLPGFSMLV